MSKEQNELKPCPFCGGEVELKDHTSNLYGFNGYEVRCKCGCGVKSHLCSEMRCQGNKISTPVTESGKAKALTDLVNLWNNAGYRKQSEGEWESFPSLGNKYRCSHCKAKVESRTNFCPNCGAKMKGGAE